MAVKQSTVIQAPSESQPALVLQLFDANVAGDIMQVTDAQGNIIGRIDKTGAAELAEFLKAGAPVDADFVNPRDGLLCVDTTNNKLWARIGGVWKGVVVA